MTDVLQPAAPGWYPDPRGTAATRFWDGDDWTEHVRGHAAVPTPARPDRAPSRPAPARPVSAGTPAGTPGAPGDGAAIASLVLGIASFMANVLLVPTILGIVFGVRALRAGTSRRGMAIAGIALSAAGVLASIIALAIMAAIAIPLFEGAQHNALALRVEDRIQAQARAEGVDLEYVTCDLPTTVVAGTTMECTAPTAARELVHIQVRFTDAAGDFTWTGE